MAIKRMDFSKTEVCYSLKTRMCTYLKLKNELKLKECLVILMYNCPNYRKCPSILVPIRKQCCDFLKSNGWKINLNRGIVMK